MCYNCHQIEIGLAEGGAMLFERESDPYTQASDFDLTSEEATGLLNGEWGFVGLTATLVSATGAVLAQASMYGIREDDSSPCALRAEYAVRWLSKQVCQKAGIPSTEALAAV